MKFLKRLSCLIILLFIANNIYAQNLTSKKLITGIILDEKEVPAEWVSVALFNSKDSSLVKTAVTNVKGSFSFEAKSGSYYYKANRIGYKVIISEIIDLSVSEIDNFKTQRLVLSSNTLKEVGITASKPLIERKNNILIMNVENSSIAIGSNALELLKKAPGVNVNQSDNISMQGKQGVLIMLDGKSTYMSNADVANLLRNMQSTEIESIELITNPSSKYDASGNSGIINIKTKKNKQFGTNGSLNTGFGVSNFFKSNTGLTLNHRESFFNLYGSYNYAYNKSGRAMTIDRISAGTPDIYFAQAGKNDQKNNSNAYKAGLDLFLNKNNTLGFLVNGYANFNIQDENNLTSVGPSFTSANSYLKSNSNTNSAYKNIAYNINYKSVLDSLGQELSFDADYAKYRGSSDINYFNYFFNKDGSLQKPNLFTRNATPTNIKIKTVKLDYALPLNKNLKLETGLKSSWVTTDNNFSQQESINGDWLTDLTKSNQFIYDENVNAIYLNLNQKIGKTDIQIGLRTEQTHSKGNSITENKIVDRNYFDFFPSLSINQELSKNHIIGLSYSRRIDRPSYNSLNPFIYFLDQYTYNVGNPFLNPQYVNNFEINYNFLSKYNATLSFSKVKNAITEVLLPDESRQALYQTNQNLATQKVLNLSLDIPVEITKWWQVSNNINIFNLKYDAENLQGKAIHSNKTSYLLKTIQTFTLGGGFTGEVSANYTSAIDGGTIAVKSVFTADLGLNKSFMDKKLNLKFALSDLFRSDKLNAYSTYPGLTYTLYQNYDSRVARLSLTYRFGQKDIKAVRNRQTGVENEQSRLKN